MYDRILRCHSQDKRWQTIYKLLVRLFLER